LKKLLVVTVVLALLVSCGDGDGGGGGGGDDGGGGNPIVAQTRKFWAQRTDNNEFYELTAELLAEGPGCEIWAEKGSGVTAAQAQSVANTYRGNIYQIMIGAFSMPISVSEVGRTFNTMEFAHWFATGETSGGKLTILLLDIKDEYVKGSNDAFVAGYFWPYDILYNGIPSNIKTNKRDMLYIDIYPMTPGSEIFNRTIVHEMQHLMNFATSLVRRVDNQNYVHTMDTWIDEGLSSAAERIYLGKHLDDRIRNFNDDSTGLIAKGNNFFAWGNREDEDPNAVLDDYATVYLFFQWLRLQTDDITIYKNIITSKEYDYKAIVTNAAKPGDDWPTVLGAWLKANYDKSSSGVFGYMGDTVLNGIKVHYAPAATSARINLYPGEGVYSYANSYNTSGLSSSGNIKYISLGTGAPTTLTGALLTYNASTTVTYSDGKLIPPESGIITGAVPPGANVTAGRFALSGVPSGPFPISAGDMLRRRGYESNFSGMNNLRLLTEAVIE
jgi:hypothetical protein